VAWVCFTVFLHIPQKIHTVMADFCHSLMQFSSVVIGNTQLFVQPWAVTLVAALSTAHIGVTTPCSHNPQQVRPNCKQKRVCGGAAVNPAAPSTVWPHHAFSHKIVYHLTNSILGIACHHCKTCVCLTKNSEAFLSSGTTVWQVLEPFVFLQNGGSWHET